MVRRIFRYFLPFWRPLVLSLIFIVLFAITSAVLMYLASTVLTSLFSSGGNVAAAVSPGAAAPSLGIYENIKQAVANWMQSLLLSGNFASDLFNLCLALVIATVAKNLFFFLQGFFAAYVEQGITKSLRDDIFTHLQTLSLQYFHRSRTGNLISTAVADVFKIHETFNNTLNNLIRDPLLIVIFLVIMLFISWKLTLIAVVVFPLILLGIYWLGKAIRRYSSRAQAAIASVSASLEETINAIRIVRAYAAEAFEIARFKTRTTEYFTTMLKINRSRLLSNPINEILGVIAFVVILYWGGLQVVQHQLMSNQDFLLFLLAMFSIINPAKGVSTVHIKINEGLAAAERIFSLLDTKPDVTEIAHPRQIPEFQNEIAFDGVSFEYNPGEPVLRDINFQVKRGEIVALVGPSGAGKSTLVDLLCRFHDPKQGQITIDGIDLRELSFGSLKALLGIVTQETILFNDSVANNIAYPSGVNDKVRLEQAARAANAYDFIMEMPRKYDTEIGNRGLMVSGGQRQRLAIARALMKDPDILIFDEATSSLDTESEKQVQEAIDHLMEGRTAIVVAHRLSTILHADQILVLKEGRIVERGKHEELLRLNGVYRKLYDLQFNQGNATKAGETSTETGSISERN